MAGQTVGGKIAGMEVECQQIVTLLNKEGQYQPAVYVQSLLQQIANARAQLEQGDPKPADVPYTGPTKT